MTLREEFAEEWEGRDEEGSLGRVGGRVGGWEEGRQAGREAGRVGGGANKT